LALKKSRQSAFHRPPRPLRQSWCRIAGANREWVGYGGPCPPPGKPHRYFFKLYALDTLLDLKPGATKAEVERALQNHILGQAQLMGTYQRK
jgi:Raf kinase inhibitor-like YbhB/YbcL family protein